MAHTLLNQLIEHEQQLFPTAQAMPANDRDAQDDEFPSSAEGGA
jgi:hypothetical protein